MGVVYHAFDPDLERQVAVKTIHQHMIEEHDGTGMLGRFKTEALATSRSQHANIILIYDFSFESSPPYMVMEYATHGDLAQYIASKGEKSINVEEVIDIGLAVLAGLEHAHGQNVVHRDIKPSNILMTELGPKITDFGVARLLDKEATEVLLIGTVGYMAPEQIVPDQSRDIDGRADLYAVSVVLFEMLTGRQPFSADHEIGLYELMLNAPRPMAETAPVELGKVLQVGLAANPDHRFQSAASFSKALHNVRQKLENSDLTRLLPPPTLGEHLPERKSTGFFRPPSREFPVRYEELPTLYDALSQDDRDQIRRVFLSVSTSRRASFVNRILSTAKTPSDLLNAMLKHVDTGDAQTIRDNIEKEFQASRIWARLAHAHQRIIPNEAKDWAVRLLATKFRGRTATIVEGISKRANNQAEFRKEVERISKQDD